MSNRVLPPQVNQMTPQQLVAYGLDNYGLDLHAERGRAELLTSIQDAKQSFTPDQDPAANPGADQQPPPAAPMETQVAPAPPDNSAPLPPPIQGEAPQPGRSFEPGPGLGVPTHGDAGALDQPRQGFAPGPPDTGPLVDSDPPNDQRLTTRQQIDIPEGFTVPDFDDDEPLDPRVEGMRQQMNQETPQKQGLAKAIFRHPNGTAWLYNPLTAVFWKPTETLMQNKEMIAVMGDPPPGANIGSS